MSGVEVVASIVPIVSSACDVALNIKDLIRDVKQYDEKMKDLEEKLDTLKSILTSAQDAYGQNESGSYSPRERDIRKTIENVVLGCDNDLKRYDAKLKRLLARGNWASLAWKQRFIAPDLAKIGKSLSDRQQRLHILVQLLQGLELRELILIVRGLDNTDPDQGHLNTNSEDQNHDADSLTQQATSLISAAELGDHQETETPPDDEEPQSPELAESIANGFSLLDAIENEDNENTFESLLSNKKTSLVEKDDEDRTPLLLAASLDRKDMVKMILDDNASGENSAQSVEIPPTGDDSSSRDTEIGDWRKIDFTTTDNIGRSVLHYFMEFGMDYATRIVLDNEVNIDARDNNNRPPAYYAVKNRKSRVLKLLLDKGASTEFDRATTIGTSRSIEDLLEKFSGNGRSGLGSSPQ
ncbi:MAG: hypothetical protein Q9195_009313 [Heterodermia aff. obscurata]